MKKGGGEKEDGRIATRHEMNRGDIERQRLAELLKEKAISLSGLTEDQPAVDVGRLLNADYMILARLHFLGSMRLCHMRLVDCATGAVVRAARVRL
ncbi:MAG: hypothetical protein JW913_13760 [Chitinispirillaceae bacterium]|nr:hypothetical protein [Chitinispirillaceae bacterium]